MYKTGDQVVYGLHGVCRVAAEETRVVDRKKVIYLVLEPVGQEGSRYLVPTHNEAAMSKVRRMLSQKEMQALLTSREVRSDEWIRDENLRKQTYRDLISSGDRASLMKMIHTLYHHQDAMSAAGKKVHLCDENFLRDAEKLLSSEVSIVLGLEPEQARSYIKEQLK